MIYYNKTSEKSSLNEKNSCENSLDSIICNLYENLYFGSNLPIEDYAVLNQYQLSAIKLLSHNISVLPLIGEKRTSYHWKKLQTKRFTLKEALIEFCEDKWALRRKKLRGIGIIPGEVSEGLCSWDFDDIPSYERFCLERPEAATACVQVKTGKGYHIYFQSASPSQLYFKPQKDGYAGEYRSKSKHYNAGPGSAHPSGRIYQYVDNDKRLDNGYIKTIDENWNVIEGSERPRMDQAAFIEELTQAMKEYINFLRSIKTQKEGREKWEIAKQNITEYKSWKEVPSNHKTKSQLEIMGLAPLLDPVAWIYHNNSEVKLFDSSETRPIQKREQTKQLDFISNILLHGHDCNNFNVLKGPHKLHGKFKIKLNRSLLNRHFFGKNQYSVKWHGHTSNWVALTIPHNQNTTSNLEFLKQKIDSHILPNLQWIIEDTTECVRLIGISDKAHQYINDLDYLTLETPEIGVFPRKDKHFQLPFHPDGRSVQLDQLITLNEEWMISDINQFIQSGKSADLSSFIEQYKPREHSQSALEIKILHVNSKPNISSGNNGWHWKDHFASWADFLMSVPLGTAHKDTANQWVLGAYREICVVEGKSSSEAISLIVRTLQNCPQKNDPNFSNRLAEGRIDDIIRVLDWDAKTIGTSNGGQPNIENSNKIFDQVRLRYQQIGFVFSECCLNPSLYKKKTNNIVFDCKATPLSFEERQKLILCNFHHVIDSDFESACLVAEKCIAWIKANHGKPFAATLIPEICSDLNIEWSIPSDHDKRCKRAETILRLLTKTNFIEKTKGRIWKGNGHKKNESCSYTVAPQTQDKKTNYRPYFGYHSSIYPPPLPPLYLSLGNDDIRCGGKKRSRLIFLDPDSFDSG